MSAYGLVSGSLWKDPEQRVSKTGKTYVTATLGANDGEIRQFWRITAFSATAQDELMRLGAGDCLSVQGAFKAELYTKDGGAQKISLSIVADRVLALRQPPKERKPNAPEPPLAERSRQERLAGSWAPGGGPNDTIPFGAP